MEVKALNLGSAVATNLGVAGAMDGGVRRQLRTLVAARLRCQDVEEVSADAVLEQIEVRRSLLARMQELRERIMHERFAGLNISPLRARRRAPRLGRNRY